jgi:signal transduction histidine kinase
MGGDPAFTNADQDLLLSFASSGATAVQTAQSVAEERLRHSMQVAEQERRRWARELHDETLQGLASLKVLLETAGGRASEDSLRSAVAQSVSELDTQIRALRSLIMELRPAALDELGLGPAIASLAERTELVEGLDVEVEAVAAPALGRFAGEVETAIYRFVQEALTNVTKHARADRAWVRIEEGPGSLQVSVRDDGIGFDPSAGTTGFGLIGMRERIALARGSLHIGSEPGSGTTVRAELPLPDRDAAPS